MFRLNYALREQFERFSAHSNVWRATIVVRADVVGAASELWESPPVESGWAGGPTVVTRVILAADLPSLCGDAGDDSNLEIYVRGGKTAAMTQVGSNFPVFLVTEGRAPYVFVLRKTEAGDLYLDGGTADLYRIDPDGTLQGRDGPTTVLALTEACP